MKRSYMTLMKEKGFSAFLGTQFLCALNDNLLKWVITYMVMAGLLHGAATSDSANLAKISEVFIFPSLLFTGFAGWLADSFNKRQVLIVTKSFEIFIMGMAWLALRSGLFLPPLIVLFLLATQFTFFGPAKYGIVPELIPDEELSLANGLLEMSTFMAILLGSTLAGPLFKQFRSHIDVIALVMLGLAVLGSWMSLGIGRVSSPDPIKRQPFKLSLAWSEVIDGSKLMWNDRRLWLTNIGISYFWFLGALFQLAVVLMGKQQLQLDEDGIGHLIMWLAIGMGAGSMLAGRLSGEKVELGLVPLGSLGLGVTAILAGLCATHAPALVPACLAGVGVFAGIFVVPLNALLQQKAGDGRKGQVIAANNFYSTLAIIASAMTLDWLAGHFALSSSQILILAGLACFGATIYGMWLLPEFVVRFSLWLLTHTFYRIRIEGGENIPRKGGALLVCNHMSLADGLLVQACMQRFVRFMVFKPIYEAKPFHYLFKAGSAIPISSKREDAAQALALAKAQVEAGHVVCIFAEGSITRTGNLLKFKRGLERIMEGADAPIIPVNLDGLWSSIFSFRGGKFSWKWPEQLPYPVTISFGQAMPGNSTASVVRARVQELGSAALETRLNKGGRLEGRLLRSAKNHFFQLAIADSSGAELSYGKMLATSLALSSELKARTKSACLGVLLPPCAAGSLVNTAASFAGLVSVNLNFTAGAESMASAGAQCELDCIVTTRAFLEKANIAPLPGMVFIEDFFTSSLKLKIALNYLICLLTPLGLLQKFYGLKSGKPDDLATIIFSSGSTGQPKGVMLSHKNISANLEGLGQVLQVAPKDRMLGVLPLFHAMGYTGSIWFPLTCGFGVLHHPNPMDSSVIGKLCGKYKASLMMSTPTFCQGYLRKCTPEQFANLRYAVLGAEKLREPLALAFKERFGIDLLEGYGATEMSPVVAINVPDVSGGGEHHVGHKLGTVGHPLPGVSAKVLDLETGAEVEPGQSGLLLLKGPSRMLGYWKRPDLTEACLKDGWYSTGDVAIIDADGFIQLTDRLSRFSKIGGEMVPHLKIEEALQPHLGEEAQCLVCALPDESRGEKLVLLYAKSSQSVESLAQLLSDSGLPKLWLPKKDAIFSVEALPVLGSGKMDLKKAKEMAASLLQPA